MVKGKRKFQEHAAQSNRAGPGQDAINRLVELALHLELRIRWSRRVGLPKVRLDMIEMETAEDVLGLIMEEVNGRKARR
jgi:hypothetical protein